MCLDITTTYNFWYFRIGLHRLCIFYFLKNMCFFFFQHYFTFLPHLSTFLDCNFLVWKKWWDLIDIRYRKKFICQRMPLFHYSVELARCQRPSSQEGKFWSLVDIECGKLISSEAYRKCLEIQLWRFRLKMIVFHKTSKNHP